MRIRGKIRGFWALRRCDLQDLSDKTSMLSCRDVPGIQPHGGEDKTIDIRCLSE